MQSPHVVNKILSLRHNIAQTLSLDQFISRHPLKIFKKGEMILLKDETPRSVYVIESGRVKAYTIDANGCEQLVSTHSKKESIPIGFIFWLTRKSPYFYEAHTDCNIRLVPRNDLLNYLSTNAKSLHSLYLKLTKKMIQMMKKINILEQSCANRKVALGLLHMPDQLGVNKRPHKSRIDLAITQQEIANTLGLTRETTSIELKKLKKMKLIDYSRNNYTLYMDRLREYVNKDSV